MIVLDTHIWVNWILGGDAALTPAVVNAMQTESRCAVSAISCFEVSLLVNRGKLELPLPVNEWLTEALANSGVESLPVTCEIAYRAVMLPEIHRDPADRIIIATTLVGMTQSWQAWIQFFRAIKNYKIDWQGNKIHDPRENRGMVFDPIFSCSTHCNQ